MSTNSTTKEYRLSQWFPIVKTWLIQEILPKLVSLARNIQQKAANIISLILTALIFNCKNNYVYYFASLKSTYILSLEALYSASTTRLLALESENI